MIEEVSSSKEWDLDSDAVQPVRKSTTYYKKTPRPKEPYIMSPAKETPVKRSNTGSSTKKAKSKSKSRSKSPPKRASTMQASKKGDKKKL